MKSESIYGFLYILFVGLFIGMYFSIPGEVTSLFALFFILSLAIPTILFMLMHNKILFLENNEELTK